VTERGFRVAVTALGFEGNIEKSYRGFQNRREWLLSLTFGAILTREISPSEVFRSPWEFDGGIHRTRAYFESSNSSLALNKILKHVDFYCTFMYCVLRNN
jgi:hypothetical protein